VPDFASRNANLPKSRLAIAGVIPAASVGDAQPRSVDRDDWTKPAYEAERVDYYEGRYDNVVSAARNAGTLIRFAFYAAGVVAFGLIALSIVRVFNAVSFYQVKAVDEGPSFRLVDSDLARLSMQTKVTNSGSLGRVETRHYGQLHDRNINLTLTLTMLPKGGAGGATGTPTTFAEVRNTLLSASTSSYGSARHDLETRFGPVHAAETRITADGLIKPCLAFQSRFESQAVRLDGTYCEATGAKPSPHRLACILDGLVLDARLASTEADAFLRGRMAQRPKCTSTPVSQTMDTQPRPVSPPSRWSTPSANRR
jgi:hypothetical protein